MNAGPGWIAGALLLLSPVPPDGPWPLALEIDLWTRAGRRAGEPLPPR